MFQGTIPAAVKKLATNNAMTENMSLETSLVAEQLFIRPCLFVCWSHFCLPIFPTFCLRYPKTVPQLKLMYCICSNLAQVNLFNFSLSFPSADILNCG